MSNPKTVILMLTCAIAIAGEVVRKGSLVEVTTEEARDLLHGGKAVVYEGDVDADDKVVVSDTVDPALNPDIALHRQDSVDGTAHPADLTLPAQEGVHEAAQAAPVVAAATSAPAAAAATETPAKRAKAAGASKPA